MVGWERDGRERAGGVANQIFRAVRRSLLLLLASLTAAAAAAAAAANHIARASLPPNLVCRLFSATFLEKYTFFTSITNDQH